MRRTLAVGGDSRIQCDLKLYGHHFWTCVLPVVAAYLERGIEPSGT